MKPELCSGCPLEHIGEGYVEGEGPEDATILLLGEALGQEEALGGRPFIGGAGRTLNFMLQRAGVKRSTLYITNVVRCRPPKNRTPEASEVTECTSRHSLPEFLTRFNLVVPMGNIPLHAVTGKTHISRWRGSVFEHNGLKILPTLHPAAIMRQQDMIPISIHDLKKINTEGWTSEWTSPVQNYNLEPHGGHVATLRDRPFSFDVETNSLHSRPGSVTHLGLCGEAGSAVVIKGNQNIVSMPYLKELFASRTLKIAHNIIFDVNQLTAQGITVGKPWFDTMLAHHLVLSDVPNDLGFVASLYTRIPYWKDQIKTKTSWYNATDADATYRIYEVLWPTIQQQNMERVFKTTMASIEPLEAMRASGVKVNTRLQLKWKIGLERKIKELDTAVTTAVGDPAFNWRSHRQLVSLLYDKLDFPRITSKFTHRPTANEDALNELFELTGSKIVKTLLKLRKLSKLSSTYFSIPLSDDNRVHSRYLLHGTATGRLSSREPNLQNVPKGPAREIYIPEEDHIFVSADYSQVELRVAAELSQETALLEAFAQGVDIHKLVASEVYGCKISDVTTDQRYRAKFIVYGLGYGRGARSLAKSYKMSTLEAQRFIDRYFVRFHRIKSWRQDLVTEAQKNGYLTNPYSRRRYFFGQHITTKVYNFLPQSTSADIMLEALVRLHRELPKSSRLVLTVHDSFMVECLKDDEDAVRECLRDVMETPVDVMGGMVFPIDITSGSNWKECE